MSHQAAAETSPKSGIDEDGGDRTEIQKFISRILRSIFWLVSLFIIAFIRDDEIQSVLDLPPHVARASPSPRPPITRMEEGLATLD